MRRRGSIFLGLTSVLLLTACQSSAVKSHDAQTETSAKPAYVLVPLSASGGVGGGAVRTDLASKDIQLPAYVPVRRYQDVFTLDGVNRKVYVEFGWDYNAGMTVETVYDEAGDTISRTAKPGTTISFTDRELELAIAIAREHPQLQSVLAADDLNFYAGFAYREVSVSGCSEKSRCVHVIVSAEDGQRHVAHAIVDLMTRSVIRPYLDPDRSPDPKPKKS